MLKNCDLSFGEWMVVRYPYSHAIDAVDCAIFKITRSQLVLVAVVWPSSCECGPRGKSWSCYQNVCPSDPVAALLWKLFIGFVIQNVVKVSSVSFPLIPNILIQKKARVAGFQSMVWMGTARKNLSC
mmetsp:Transcript_115494/g.333617  ORF Transcript_115494/g.333617 Transcript_115494/m.333617 type:complete len:127 (+) Transcript_115494:232-612(+)